MSLYGPTFHATPVDLCIIFQCNLYISCIMSCGNKIVSNCMNDLFGVTVATNERNVELIQLNFRRIRLWRFDHFIDTEKNYYEEIVNITLRLNEFILICTFIFSLEKIILYLWPLINLN